MYTFAIIIIIIIIKALLNFANVAFCHRVYGAQECSLIYGRADAPN